MEKKLINYIALLVEENSKMDNSLREDSGFLSDATRTRYLHYINCKLDIIKNLKQLL